MNNLSRPRPLFRNGRRTDAGFSLVELLVTIGIASILAAISLSALKGTAGAAQLDAGGNRVVDLVNEARQNSITKNVMTALILVTGTGNSAIDNRLWVVADYENGTWTQISKWELLPSGVIVDSSSTPYTDSTTPSYSAFFGGSMPTPPSSASLTSGASKIALSYLGTSIVPSKYLVFLPGGRVLDKTLPPPVLRMTTGAVNAGTVSYTSVTAGVPNNYYDITINVYTGVLKVDRP